MDREKVINGLEQFRADLKPFCGNHADWERFDAGLSLLKEQEAVEPRWFIDAHNPAGAFRCGACGERIIEKNIDFYCSKCGTPVLWKGR